MDIGPLMSFSQECEVSASAIVHLALTHGEILVTIFGATSSMDEPLSHRSVQKKQLSPFQTATLIAALKMAMTCLSIGVPSEFQDLSSKVRIRQTLRTNKAVCM